MASAKAAAVTKKAAPSAKKPRSHPPYPRRRVTLKYQMVKEAIMALKEKTGSSQYAIAKHIEDNHKDLPPNFKKMLLLQLKKLVAAGNLTKVKNSFKLASASVAAAVKAKSGAQVKPKKAKVKTPVKAKKAGKKAAPAKKVKSPAKKVAVKKAKK